LGLNRRPRLRIPGCNLINPVAQEPAKRARGNATSRSLLLPVNIFVVKIQTDYLRNLIFGVEDALVSTAGVVFGVASSGKYTPSQTILTGLIVVAVEALSMGVGSYLSEESVHEVEKKHTDNPVVGALIMFFSYLLAGTAAVAPYALMAPSTAKYASAAISIVLLFLLGLLPKRSLRDGLRMVIVAGLAIAIGYAIGHLDISMYVN